MCRTYTRCAYASNLKILDHYDGTIELIANGIVFDPWVG